MHAFITKGGEPAISVGGKLYTAGDVEAMIDTLTDLARAEAADYAPVSALNDRYEVSDIAAQQAVDAILERYDAAPADHAMSAAAGEFSSLVSDIVTDHTDAAIAAVDTYAAQYARHEIGETCADLLRRIRGYV